MFYTWVPVLFVFEALLVISWFIACEAHVELDYRAEERIKQGEAKLMELRDHTGSPHYGSCWTKALTLLDDGCRHLTEDVQQRLAIEFTYCFLLKAGRPMERCEASEPSESCTRRMPNEAFNAYTQFFTHTQNICFYLQATAWQEQTENTIDRLTDNSAAVARQLENASELQTELLKQQNASLVNQKILLNSGEELRQTLEESKIDVRTMMTDLQKSTYEQRDLIFEVFDRVRSLQSIVMGEFAGFYSLIFYALAILIAYVLTSTPRTSSSRFWLFVILTMNMTAEWLLAKWCQGSEQVDKITGQLIDENTLVFARIKSCRMSFMILAVVVWGWMAYRYQDLNQINNELLVYIKHQNVELKNLLQISGRGVTLSVDTCDGVATELSTGYETLNVETDADDDRSRKDATVDHSYAAALGKTVSNVGRYFTSLRNLEVSTLSADDELSTLDTSQISPTSTRRPRRRRKTTITDTNVDSTPVIGRYNLRSRSSTPSSGPLYVIDPPVAVVSPTTVQHLVNVVERNTMKTLRTVQNSQLCASSDED